MLVCVLFVCICTRDRGCSVHPVFPAPSLFQEGRELPANLGRTSRGIAKRCLGAWTPVMLYYNIDLWPIPTITATTMATPIPMARQRHIRRKQPPGRSCA